MFLDIAFDEGIEVLMVDVVCEVVVWIAYPCYVLRSIATTKEIMSKN